MKNDRFSLYSLIASSIALLSGDILEVLHHESILWTICLTLSFLLFIGGLPAINSLIYTSNPAPRLLINISLLVGAIAGASMQVLFRTIIILENEKFSDAALALSTNNLLKFTTMVPGIFYPIGLILLCLALFFSKKYPVWKVLLLLLGAIFFPVGHAIGNDYALVLGDILLLSAWLIFSPDILNNSKNNINFIK